MGFFLIFSSKKAIFKHQSKSYWSIESDPVSQKVLAGPISSEIIPRVTSNYKYEMSLRFLGRGELNTEVKWFS